MASASGGKAVNGQNPGGLRRSGENSSPELLSEHYEGLFENEEKELPCYLPDSGQAEDGAPQMENDDKTGETADNSVIDSLQGTRNLKAPENYSGTIAVECDSRAIGMGSLEREGGGSSFANKLESREAGGDGDLASTHSSTGGLSVISDRELSSDHGVDGLPSPDTSRGGRSGYTAGSGRRCRRCAGGVVVNADSRPLQECEGNGSGKTQGASEPGKRHSNEDDTHASWRGHKKHFFILSNAGKPVYSRYGDEHKLAGFSATLQAIMSFVENSGDTIHWIRAGDHQILFLVRGPLYLVCISSTEEPYLVLKNQLELLHGQLLLILTNSVEKCFVKNSKFDMRPLLGGTEVVFSSLIHAFSWNPASFIHAYTCLPLPYAARQAAVVALQDMTETGALFALLMCGTKVIGLVGPRRESLHPDDILLLSNFISSSDSFRTSESFSPICLPRYNLSAFMYAYVQYLDEDACLILLTGDSGKFFDLKECRTQVEVALRESNVLHEVNNSVLHGGLRVNDLPDAQPPLSDEGINSNRRTISAAGDSVPGIGGAAGLWHFIFRSTYLDQYVASEFSPPLHTRLAQKRLYRAYQSLHSSMHGNENAAGPHKMQYRRDDNHVLFSWRTTEFELYAAFDPLAEKSVAITVCNRVCQWVRDMESEIFLLGATSLSW